MTVAEQQAFAVYQQLYLLRCLYIIRFYQFAQAYGQRNSLEKEAGTDAGLFSEIAPTEKDPTGHLGVEPIAPQASESQAFELEKYLAKTPKVSSGSEKAKVENNLKNAGGDKGRIVSKLEIKSTVTDNYDSEKYGKGVQGIVEYKLTTPEGKVITHTQDVVWASKAGERPTYPTPEGTFGKVNIIPGRDEYTAKKDKVTHRIHVSGQESAIFIHAGRLSQGCHCVGRGDKAEFFLKEIERSSQAENFAGASHEVIEGRKPEKIAARPGKHIGEVSQ